MHPIRTTLKHVGIASGIDLHGELCKPKPTELKQIISLLETAVEGIASNRPTQPSMHCSLCQFKSGCLAWRPGITTADLQRTA